MSIQRSDVMPINFLKKENFHGSYQGMRYRMAKSEIEVEKEGEEPEKQTMLEVAVWPEPYSFSATSEEEKTYEHFPFTEEGILMSIEWMNKIYETIDKREIR